MSQPSPYSKAPFRSQNITTMLSIVPPGRNSFFTVAGYIVPG